jgi:hypothetical protein
VSGGPWPVLLCQGIDPAGEVGAWDWPTLVQALTWPGHARKKLECPAWLPVAMKGKHTRRASEHVDSVWALVVDLDEDAPDFATLAAAVQALDLVAIVHTTWSHTRDRTRARAVFPFEKPAPADRWLEVWQCAEVWAAKWGATMDPACKDPARLYFLPCIDVSTDDRRWLTSEEFDAEVCGPDDRPYLRWRELVAYHRPKVKPQPQPALQVQTAGMGSAKLEQARTRDEKRRAAYVRAAVDRVLDELAAMGEGGRNSACFRAGASLGRFVQSGDLEAAAVIGEVVAAAVAAGLSESEAARAVDNGLRAAEREDPWGGLT